MTTPVYNDTLFRAQFPEFADTTAYPAATLSQWWTMGTNYISTSQPGWLFSGAAAQLANDLMGAHLAKTFSLIAGGSTPGVMQSASEGSVSVSMVPPPVKSAFGYWLATTAYGAQLRALLRAIAGPGLYVGGLPERAGFRKTGGVF
jgi:Protein of unknown function (DUF4054)